MLELIAAILEIAAEFYGCYPGNDSGNYHSYDDFGQNTSFDNDEDLYANTGAWRSLHPYDYNPYTGGSNQSEDMSNGWY